MKNTNAKNLRRWMLVMTGFGCLAATAAQAADDKAKASEDNTEYNNWITLGVGTPFISGDSQSFMQRYQMNKSVVGGVEDFHWEQNVGKKGLFELNGHGIYDSHNFGADFKLSDPDIGYVKAGYEQFRTWYDNSGGYFPGSTNRWFELPKDLGVDRGRAWFEAGLVKDNLPEITFRYEHEFRDGNKSSTVWGDSDVSTMPGVYPVPTATSRATRNFVPAFYGLDEKRDIFSLNVKQNFGKTDLTIGGSYEHVDNSDSRNMSRRPGEVTGANTAQRADRYVTERETLQEDLFTAHALTETRFNDKVKLAVGGIFSTLDTDIGGSRIYGNQFDPVLGPYLRTQQRDSGYFNVLGGGNVKQYVANLNLMVTPAKNLVIVPSVRIEREYVEGFARYTPTTVNSAGGPLVTNAVTLNNADRDLLEVTEGLEARYSGFKNWSLYARAELSEACENRAESTISTSTNRYLSDWSRFMQKYTAGANWFVLPGLNMGGQYYYRISDNEWKEPTSKATRYIQTHDLNYRLTWRPLSQLSFVSRYDFQLSSFKHKPDNVRPEVESADITSHILSESINWTPTARLYLQLNGSYAWDGAVNTPVDGAFGATNAVPSLKNGYWTANATLGYALDEVSDFTLQYTFYKADNYVNNALWSQPYGADSVDHSITATITRQLNKRTAVSLKYGYFTSDDNASGNHNNYDAHLIYATMQYKF